MILMYRCCGKSEYYVINSDNIMQFTKLVKLPFLGTGIPGKDPGGHSGLLL